MHDKFLFALNGNFIDLVVVIANTKSGQDLYTSPYKKAPMMMVPMEIHNLCILSPCHITQVLYDRFGSHTFIQSIPQSYAVQCSVWYGQRWLLYSSIICLCFFVLLVISHMYIFYVFPLKGVSSLNNTLIIQIVLKLKIVFLLLHWNSYVWCVVQYLNRKSEFFGQASCYIQYFSEQ